MQGMINALRGTVRVEVTGAYPERFMNLSAENQVAFWDMERVDPVTIRVTMHIQGYKRMRPLAENAMCAMKPVRKSGAPFFLWRLRKRYALLVGLLLAVTALFVLSLYIWEIEVVGNETIPAAEILETLEEVGVGVGFFAPSVEPAAVRDAMLLKLDELLWLTVNINGSRAVVIVRERIPPPEIVDHDTPAAIYAAKTGVIEKITVLEGLPLYKVGDTVLQGEDLVSGRMESLSSSVRLVRARAEVYARTWYEFSVQMPLELMEKQYTGESSTKSTISFVGKRINLFFNSRIPYAACDKITEETSVTLPGGILLPIAIQTSTYNEYEKVYSVLAEDQAEALLKERLLDKLEASLLPGGEIRDESYAVSVTDGVMTVTLRAECLEQIGGARPLSQEELQIPAEPEPAAETEEGNIN